MQYSLPKNLKRYNVCQMTYCDTWKLSVNTNKTKVVIFEKGRHTSYDFYYGNTLLNIVDCFKYLGMYFYKNGNWLRSENQLVKHSHPAMHNLCMG